MNFFKDNLFRELIIDNFAGGGGASTGIELAVGEPVDIAINHDGMAIKMHEANHPFTTHYHESVWDIKPKEVTMGRSVGLAWFSPDCTHFSKAKGGKPKKKEIRGLAWVVIRWAATVKPRVIILENVEEFKTWGPLDKNGYPIKEKQGQIFNSWKQRLIDLGYEIDLKELRACDYGAPTTRNRLFIIARCDGQPIVWPKPTHGNVEGLLPYKTASEIIDWSLKGESIFTRKRPLVEATLKRITRGIDKYVIKNPKPFILQYHSETRNEQARVYDIDEPLLTVDGSNRFGVVTPIISQLGHTGFNSDRNRNIKEPLSTIVSKNEHLLTTPVLMVNNTGHPGSDIKKPLPTITTGNHHYAINPSIIPIGYGEAPKQLPRVNDTKEPLGTVVSMAKHHVVIPHVIKHYSGEHQKGSDVNDPLGTITSIDHNGLVSAVMSSYYSSGDNVAPVDEPVRTITSIEKHGLVKVYFRKVENSNIGHWPQIRHMLNAYSGYFLSLDEIIVFEINNIEYILVDIEMRMLTPKELYAAQGFPSDYNFDLNGQMSKTEQIKKCGNSVCPQLATALVKANYEPAKNIPVLNTMKELYNFTTFGSIRLMKSKE